MNHAFSPHYPFHDSNVILKLEPDPLFKVKPFKKNTVREKTKLKYNNMQKNA